jgi:hypothetical protein
VLCMLLALRACFSQRFPPPPRLRACACKALSRTLDALKRWQMCMGRRRGEEGKEDGWAEEELSG